jgi:hypothetical protein
MSDTDNSFDRTRKQPFVHTESDALPAALNIER